MTVDYSKPIEYVASHGEIWRAETVDDAVRIILPSGKPRIVFADLAGKVRGRGDNDWWGRVRNIPQPPAECCCDDPASCKVTIEPPQPPEFRVDAPGQYVQRNGGIATVTDLCGGSEDYPIFGRDAEGTLTTWRETGRFHVCYEDRADLIAKAPQPPARITAPGTYKQRDGRLAWVREIVPLEIPYPVRGIAADGTEQTWTLEGVSRTDTARSAIVFAIGDQRGTIRGTIQCPICEAGTLSYSRSGYNGHIHARCSTDGCVAWME